MKTDFIELTTYKIPPGRVPGRRDGPLRGEDDKDLRRHSVFVLFFSQTVCNPIQFNPDVKSNGGF